MSNIFNFNKFYNMGKTSSFIVESMAKETEQRNRETFPWYKFEDVLNNVNGIKDTITGMFPTFERSLSDMKLQREARMKELQRRYAPLKPTNLLESYISCHSRYGVYLCIFSPYVVGSKDAAMFSAWQRVNGFSNIFEAVNAASQPPWKNQRISGSGVVTYGDIAENIRRDLQNKYSYFQKRYAPKSIEDIEKASKHYLYTKLTEFLGVIDESDLSFFLDISTEQTSETEEVDNIDNNDVDNFTNANDMEEFSNLKSGSESYRRLSQQSILSGDNSKVGLNFNGLKKIIRRWMSNSPSPLTKEMSQILSSMPVNENGGEISFDGFIDYALSHQELRGQNPVFFQVVDFLGMRPSAGQIMPTTETEDAEDTEDAEEFDGAKTPKKQLGLRNVFKKLTEDMALKHKNPQEYHNLLTEQEGNAQVMSQLYDEAKNNFARIILLGKKKENRRAIKAGENVEPLPWSEKGTGEAYKTAFAEERRKIDIMMNPPDDEASEEYAREYEETNQYFKSIKRPENAFLQTMIDSISGVQKKIQESDPERAMLMSNVLDIRRTEKKLYYKFQNIMDAMIMKASMVDYSLEMVKVINAIVANGENNIDGIVNALNEKKQPQYRAKPYGNSIATYTPEIVQEWIRYVDSKKQKLGMQDLRELLTKYQNDHANYLEQYRKAKTNKKSELKVEGFETMEEAVESAIINFRGGGFRKIQDKSSPSGYRDITSEDPARSVVLTEKDPHTGSNINPPSLTAVFPYESKEETVAYFDLTDYRGKNHANTLPLSETGKDRKAIEELIKRAPPPPLSIPVETDKKEKEEVEVVDTDGEQPIDPETNFGVNEESSSPQVETTTPTDEYVEGIPVNETNISLSPETNPLLPHEEGYSEGRAEQEEIAPSSPHVTNEPDIYDTSKEYEEEKSHSPNNRKGSNVNRIILARTINNLINVADEMDNEGNYIEAEEIHKIIRKHLKGFK